MLAAAPSCTTVWTGMSRAGGKTNAITAISSSPPAVPTMAAIKAVPRAAADRPAYSVLDCSSTGADLGLEQVSWQESLRVMLEASAGR